MVCAINLIRAAYNNSIHPEPVQLPFLTRRDFGGNHAQIVCVESHYGGHIKQFCGAFFTANVRA
jgi:hypothetical protein